jgi:pentatricopeptide repeat protein
MVKDHDITAPAAAHNARITYKSMNDTVEEVEGLIHTMREDAGLRLDVVTYNTLMRAMARHGRVDDALEVYRRLKKGEEARVVPECATYTCVVSALCGLGRWSEAEDVFYEGLKRRKVSDLGIVLQLVRGLMHAGKRRAARRVVVGLCKKFPRPV